MILYHASSSYYSMIARLALLEANVQFESHRLDIHFAKQQLAPWYVAINPAMTVPTLSDGKTVWTDSRDILAFARDSAGACWADSDPPFGEAVEDIVNQHYAIEIEKLTFGTAFLSKPMLRVAFLHFLQTIVRKLSRSLPTAENRAAVSNKIIVNEERLAFFSASDLAQRVEEQRQRVVSLVKALSPGSKLMLFGDRISSADIVVGVLLARLKMIGLYEQTVGSNAPLRGWYSRYRLRIATQEADLWERFQPLRIILRR